MSHLHFFAVKLPEGFIELRVFDRIARPGFGDLAKRLADELRNYRETGQPVINEQVFPTGMIRVTVIWDEWNSLPLEDRTAIILRAYDLAEGQAYREKIALASGLTVPEASAAGMLPFQIFPAIRSSDAVALDQCYQTMIDEGASPFLQVRRVYIS